MIKRFSWGKLQHIIFCDYKSDSSLIT